MFKKSSRFAGVIVTVTFLASSALAQQVRVYRDGDSWTQEMTGTLSAARNLHVKVDFGSVRVQGGSQQDITYVIRTRSYSSEEKTARREFESYKIKAIGRARVTICVPVSSSSTYRATWSWPSCRPPAVA